MSKLHNPLDANFTDFSINDFIVQMHHSADKQEFHEAFQGELPEYVTKAAKLRQMADDLAKARDAAAGGDKDKIAEKKAQWAAGQLALTMNAQHLVMLSTARKDPGLLANGGYEFKQKNSSKTTVDLLSLLPEVFANHGSASGLVIVLVKRILSNANIELQTSLGDPLDEASWISQGMYTKSRIELKGLEPASKIHLRARYHEHGHAGKWSRHTTIIVL